MKKSNNKLLLGLLLGASLTVATNVNALTRDDLGVIEYETPFVSYVFTSLTYANERDVRYILKGAADKQTIQAKYDNVNRLYYNNTVNYALTGDLSVSLVSNGVLLKRIRDEFDGKTKDYVKNPMSLGNLSARGGVRYRIVPFETDFLPIIELGANFNLFTRTNEKFVSNLFENLRLSVNLTKNVDDFNFDYTLGAALYSVANPDEKYNKVAWSHSLTIGYKKVRVSLYQNSGREAELRNPAVLQYPTVYRSISLSWTMKLNDGFTVIPTIGVDHQDYKLYQYGENSTKFADSFFAAETITYSYGITTMYRPQGSTGLWRFNLNMNSNNADANEFSFGVSYVYNVY